MSRQKISNVSFLIDGTPFEVAIGVFYSERASPKFLSQIQDTFDEHGVQTRPFTPAGVAAAEFESLLRVLPPSDIRSAPLSLNEWTSVLHLSTLWGLRRIRETAIYAISHLETNPITRISLARRLDIPRWIGPAHAELVARSPTLTQHEIQLLGHDAAVEILRLRDGLTLDDVGVVDLTPSITDCNSPITILTEDDIESLLLSKPPWDDEPTGSSLYTPETPTRPNVDLPDNYARSSPSPTLPLLPNVPWLLATSLPSIILTLPSIPSTPITPSSPQLANECTGAQAPDMISVDISVEPQESHPGIAQTTPEYSTSCELSPSPSYTTVSPEVTALLLQKPYPPSPERLHQLEAAAACAVTEQFRASAALGTAERDLETAQLVLSTAQSIVGRMDAESGWLVRALVGATRPLAMSSVRGAERDAKKAGAAEHRAREDAAAAGERVRETQTALSALHSHSGSKAYTPGTLTKDIEANWGWKLDEGRRATKKGASHGERRGSGSVNGRSKVTGGWLLAGLAAVGTIAAVVLTYGEMDEEIPEPRLGF